ncbi:FxsA family protein [Pseudomonas sp. F1_0610]|uniref:FxsA family protein n=1 Tax=Pseudomonas sp. F1_0610 TaxID=3114284 RepID=UPI0039C0D726
MPLIIFLVFSLLELFLLIKVGGAIGAGMTILLLVLSGILGVSLIRIAGVSTAVKARERLAQGQMPNREMAQGLFMALAGFLLLLPGFITDILGLLLLLPSIRSLVGQQLQRRSTAQSMHKNGFYQNQGQTYDADTAQSTEPKVLEGEYQRKDD